MSLVYIASVTASSSASVSFTTGIDSTYNEYKFHFVNIHPASAARLSFQVNASGQTGFNEVMTTTNFVSEHDEGDTGTSLAYRTAYDQAQGTAYQVLTENIYTNNDDGGSGILTLFDPSSTTYVKHFISTVNVSGNTFTDTNYVAGYINVTAAIDEISFAMSTGNMDSGTIHMYGVG